MDATKRRAIEHEHGRKRGIHHHFPTDTSKSSQLHQAYWKECEAQKEHTPEMEHIERQNKYTNVNTRRKYTS
jgi:hypothetical protein